ncbi:hypothetical protein [Rathayibacter oskolensis]|uniref:hypothetical protein n=1 Tax=Rathayibacter oskolensis TaxID=1891671 RepID=UPI0034659B9F
MREVIADYRAELLAAMRAGAAARWPGASSAWRAQQADVLVSLLVAALVLARVDSAQSVATVDAALALVRAPHAS